MTPKATQLEAALALAPAERVGDAVVVPLLNGIDHVALLRDRYEHVLAATFRAESERVEPGLVRQKTPFLRIDLGPGPRRDELAEELRAAGSTSCSRPTSRRCSGRSSPSSRRSR